jgi:hypothetical protein
MLFLIPAIDPSLARAYCAVAVRNASMSRAVVWLPFAKILQAPLDLRDIRAALHFGR